jgi:D-alanyl-D-alanine carboxypeptidase
VRSLIDNNINVAAVKRTAPPVVESSQIAQVQVRKEGNADDRTGSAPVRMASAAPVATDAPMPGSTEPIKPIAVKTVIVHPGTLHAASLSPLPSDNRQLAPAPSVANPVNVTTVTTIKSELPLTPAAPPVQPVPASPAPPQSAKPAVLGTAAKVASTESNTPVAAAAAESMIKVRNGWIVQVGALPDEKEAKQRLEAARSKAKDWLGKAEPFTERLEKGDKVLFRARFAGLEKDQAEAACKHLKRNEIPCMLLKN